MNDTQIQLLAIVLFCILLFGGWYIAFKILRRYMKFAEKQPVSENDKRFEFLEELTAEALLYTNNEHELTVEEQRLINAVLQQPPSDDLVEFVRSSDWQHARFSNSVGTFVSFYAFNLSSYSPHIIARKTGYKSTALRFFMQILESQHMVYVEGMIDKDYDIFTTKENVIDALTILSPEVLEVLHGAPKAATIMIKRNKLIYIVYGTSRIEDDLNAFKKHASRLASELNENLQRYARSAANQRKLQAIKSNPIGLSDKEYYDQPNGKMFTRF